MLWAPLGDGWFFCIARKEWGPISLGAHERQTSTFQGQPEFSGGSLEAKPARSLPCSLGSMKPHSVTMFSLLLQCHNGPLLPWAPECHNGLHGSTVPCRTTTALWLHKALECSNGLLVPQSPAAQHWALGTMRPSSATVMSLVPQGPTVSPWSPQEGNHSAPVFQGQ